MDKLEIVRNPAGLLKLEQTDPALAEKLWNGLSRAERSRALMAVSGSQRERLITLAHDAAGLVRAMPADEFARTVLEIGPDDAGGLLALCADEQLIFLLDLTGWRRERLSPARYETWLPIILEGGQKRVLGWLEASDVEVLALMFASWFRVVKWLPSQDEQEPPDDLPAVTLDNVFYLEFRRPELQEMVMQVLVQLISEKPDLYNTVLEAMLWESAAGMADQAAHWRSGRMADAGFPDRLEALELWAPPSPGEEQWRDMPEKTALGFMSDAPPRSDFSASLLPPEQTLPSLAGEMEGPAADALRAELAYIANCGMVALEADPADPEDVAKAARESLGLVNLGVELLSGSDRATAARIIARVGLAALARQGAAAIRRINRRAWQLTQEGWISKVPTGLLILDYPLDRWLAGLMYPRPRCFDSRLGQGVEYRSFMGVEDLEAAARSLDLAEFWGELLLDMLGISPEELAALLDHPYHPRDPEEIKLTQVMGTWLACRTLGLEGLRPVPAARLAEAVDGLQKGLQGELDRQLRRSLEAIADPGKASMAGEALRGVLRALGDELGGIDPTAVVEARFVGGLVVGP